MALTQYDDDLHAWAVEQAKILRARDYQCLDWENLAEEVEAMARKERRELESRLHTLMWHLLKWQTRVTEEPQASSGWKQTIREQRRKTRSLLKQSPSLTHHLDEYLADAYDWAVKDCRDELPMYPYPAERPWTVEDLLDENFLPTPE